MIGTRITVPVGNAEGSLSTQFVVAEGFDHVMDNVSPLNGAPSSALEHRQRSVYHVTDGGGRVWIPPQGIALVEEAVDTDE